MVDRFGNMDKMDELIKRVEKESFEFTHTAKEIRAINQNQYSSECVPENYSDINRWKEEKQGIKYGGTKPPKDFGVRIKYKQNRLPYLVRSIRYHLKCFFWFFCPPEYKNNKKG
ncbi:MAG: hypothetical protein PF517_11490 [Salinivirgaceae bacterium]|jgi:hypothetical protein|nr:hypothetical protein [Salinivirgaceae bacterium]